MPITKQVSRDLRLNNDPMGYRGRNIIPLKKITNGSTAGQQVTIDFPINNRKHGFQLLCQSVNYTGGVGQATKKITGAGDDALTVTLTLVNREPSAVAIVAAGTGYAVNDTFSVVDATGTGAVFKVTAIGGGGAVTTATYNAGTATASPVEPDFLIQNPVITVGDVTPYQVDALFYTMRRQAQGLVVPLGVCPVDFSDPETDRIQGNDETSWDTFGAKQLLMQFTLNANAVKPSITGQEDFDFLRNSFTDAKGNPHIFANPLKFSKQTIDLLNGTQEIQNLVINGAVRRMFIKCNTTPGSISSFEFWADGQLRLQGNVADINKRYRDFGWQFGDKVGYAVSNIATSNTLKAALNPFNFFDAALIFDFDGRLKDTLAVGQHNLKITSSVAQKATVYIESLPGKFA